MKKCPFCAEEIQDAAIKCRYCGSQLDAPPESVATMPESSKPSGTEPSIPPARQFHNVTESDARLIEEGAVIELRAGGSISQRAERLLADKHVTVLRPAAAASVSGAATVPSSDGWYPGKGAPPEQAPGVPPARRWLGAMAAGIGSVLILVSSTTFGIVVLWLGLAFAMTGRAITRWGGGLLIALVLGALLSSIGTSIYPSAPTSSSVTQASTQPASSATLTAGGPPTGKWTRTHDTSAMDDSQGISFRLESENQIEGWLKKETPELVIRCKEHVTGVYMRTGMAASVESGSSEGHTVRLRFDDAPAQSETWTESTDDKALFAPDAVATARKIASAKTLRIQFTPFNASKVIATFEVSGFDQHLAQLAATCKWPEPAPKKSPNPNLLSSLIGQSATVVERRLGKAPHITENVWAWDADGRIVWVMFNDANVVVGVEPGNFDIRKLRE